MSRTTDEIQDELLVVRCLRKEELAWQELVQRYSPRLLYFLRRLISDEDLAASLLQDVWLAALRGLSRLQRHNRLAPWLYGIAHRLAMGHLRRTYREARDEQTAESEIDLQDLERQLQAENAELVHYGLERIGLREREVLTLFFLEDLSLQEIADVFEIPLGTVKSRLHKARRDLKQVLEDEALRPPAARTLRESSS